MPGIKKYERLVAELQRHVHDGVLARGERIPSVRAMSQSKRLSINTVMKAYAVLESHRRVRSMNNREPLWAALVKIFCQGGL